jgi:hypothetical protein
MLTSEDNLTRRGFLVLAVSAAGALFIKPRLVVHNENKAYLVSVETTGYGFLWFKEGEEYECDRVLAGVEPYSKPEPDAREIARESLMEGSVLRFERHPDIDPEEPYLLVVDAVSGEAVCDIPWCACREEERVVRGIMGKMDEGMEVWGEVTSARHYTMDACSQLARIHTIEFDVYFR